jgi:hypothetical protein
VQPYGYCAFDIVDDRDLHGFFFAKVLSEKNLLSCFCYSVVFFFPLSFLLSRSPWGALGMVWGVYFEALVFSNFHAIHEQYT